MAAITLVGRVPSKATTGLRTNRIFPYFVSSACGRADGFADAASQGGLRQELGLSCLRAARRRGAACARRGHTAGTWRRVEVDWPLWRAGGWKPSEETWPRTPLAEYWPCLAEEPPAAEDFYGRQAIYRRLIAIEELQSLFPGPQLDDCPTRHFLWAYAVQLDWQWRSGRLGEDRSISPDSWWGCVNYTLCVLPFLGAVEAGLLEPTPLQEPPSELKAALASWTKFWQDLKVTAQQQGGVALTERQLDRVQQALWFCHTESIQMALKIYEPQLLLLSREEQLFGSGWARFVEVLAAVAWRTDLEAVASLGAGYLPLTRLATDADGSHGGEPREVELFRTGTSTVQQVATVSERSLQLMVSFWRRVGRNFSRRVAVPEVILTLTRPNQPRLLPIFRLLCWYIRPGKRD